MYHFSSHRTLDDSWWDFRLWSALAFCEITSGTGGPRELCHHRWALPLPSLLSVFTDPQTPSAIIQPPVFVPHLSRLHFARNSYR